MPGYYEGCSFCRAFDFTFGVAAVLSALGLGYALTGESDLLAEFPGGAFYIPHLMVGTAAIASGFTGAKHIARATREVS